MDHHAIDQVVRQRMTHRHAEKGLHRFDIAPVNLAVVVVLAGLAGVLAAVFPARRAARLDILRAIVSE